MRRHAFGNSDIWDGLHDENNQEIDIGCLGELDHEVLEQKGQ